MTSLRYELDTANKKKQSSGHFVQPQNQLTALSRRSNQESSNDKANFGNNGGGTGTTGGEQDSNFA